MCIAQQRLIPVKDPGRLVDIWADISSLFLTFHSSKLQFSLYSLETIVFKITHALKNKMVEE